MSRIVTAAKPALERLVLLDWTPPTADERLAVAAWATLVTMNFEFGHKETAASAERDHRHIWQTGRPPPGWRIWIGIYRDLMPRHHHRGAGLFHPGYAGEPHANVQTSVFNVGLLFMQTMSSSTPLVDFNDVQHHADSPFVPIWPDMAWKKPREAIGPEHTELILDNFTGMLERHAGGETARAHRR
jgi:hypothetical protein